MVDDRLKTARAWADDAQETNIEKILSQQIYILLDIIEGLTNTSGSSNRGNAAG